MESDTNFIKYFAHFDFGFAFCLELGAAQRSTLLAQNDEEQEQPHKVLFSHCHFVHCWSCVFLSIIIAQLFWKVFFGMCVHTIWG